MRHILIWLWLVVVACLLKPLGVGAADATASIEVTVVDLATHAGVPEVQIALRETNRTARTDSSGRANFQGLPTGTFTLVCARMGFWTDSTMVTTRSGEVTKVTHALQLSPVEIPGIESTDRLVSTDGLRGQTALQLQGAELTSSLRPSVAQTIAGRAGVSEQSLGPNTARPVLRGLGGHRVQILEDSSPTGDLSATAPDHAVLADPFGAERIDLIRGPAALMYGSQTAGGVVDVKRELIAPGSGQRPSIVTGQYSSVNRSVTGQYSGGYTFGKNQLRLELGGQSSGDLATPIGVLQHTEGTAHRFGAGISRTIDYGFLGASYKGTWTDYGIPGGFVGGHSNGVTIEMQAESFEAVGKKKLGSRQQTESETAVEFTRYYHKELESNSVCGVSFGILSYRVDHRMKFVGSSGDAVFIVGAGGQYRDLEQGCLSFLPPVTERSISTFVYGQRKISAFLVSSALRADGIQLHPSGDRKKSKAGVIENRSFLTYSIGLSGRLDMAPHSSVTLSLLSSSSAPSYEQLYADGPHLASFSYEVGNSQLSPERSTGVDLSLEAGQSRTKGRLSLFVTFFDRYLFPRNTGELEYGPGETGVLPRYQYSGYDALLSGGELELTQRLSRGITLTTNLNYVHGEFINDNAAVPFIPPLTGRVALRASRGRFSGTGQMDFAQHQDRVGEFESSTSGWISGTIAGEFALSQAKLVHTVICRIENVGDALYRNHLSRIKSVYPEPGRNVVVTYRLLW